MKEELYILNNGKWVELELNTPSGITFEFKSTLFADITKITSSKTFTFTLPASAKNNLALECLHDIRNKSSVLGAKIPCMYKIDSMMFVQNPFLYISQVSKGKEYKAIMSWGGVIMEEDANINELYEGNYIFSNESCDNTYLSHYTDNRGADGIVFPYYSCGVPNLMDENSKRYVVDEYKFNKNEILHYITTNAPSLPCVTVKSIVDKISERYGLNFDFNRTISKSEWSAVDEIPNIIKRGVIPVTDASADTDFLKEHTSILKYAHLSRTPDSWESVRELNINDLITFSGHEDRSMNNFTAKSTTLQTWNNTEQGYKNYSLFYSLSSKIRAVGMKIDGKIAMTVDITFQRDPDKYKKLHIIDTFGINTQDTEVEGSKDGNIWIYDFSGDKAINLKYQGDIYFGFERLDTSTISGNCNITFDGDITITPVMDVLSSEVHMPYRPWLRLPSISCKEFIKSLFFISGGFPTLDKSGKIHIVYYNQIENNINNGTIYDWSKYLTDKEDVTIKYSDNSLGITNYYLMNNESIEGSSKDNDNAAYDKIFAALPCRNMSLNTTKTIIQLPYYSRFVKDMDNPSIETGNTFQYYKMKDGKLQIKESKPTIGLLSSEQRYDVVKGSSVDVLKMETWQFPNDLSNSEAYRYFAKIINNPQYVECKMSIPAMVLKDVDFAVPIYIEHFNSLFVATDIKYSTKSGISTVNLIKLPNK